MKPHRGKFSNCRKVTVSKPRDGHLGFYFVGTFDPSDDRVGYRRFGGRSGYTSLVVKVDGNEIETLNSRYTIVDCYNSDEFKANNYQPV